MSIITRMRKQTAVYWAPDSYDEQGKPTWQTPVEVLVRWDGKREEFRNEEGETRLSNAVVYLPEISAGVDPQINGVLLLGALSSSVDQANPLNNAGAFEIQMFEKIPNLKATEFLRICYL